MSKAKSRLPHTRTYRDQIVGSAADLPAQAAAPVRDSLEAALRVAADLPRPGGDAPVRGGRIAYTDAMNRAALVGAGVVLIAVLVALNLLPSGPQARDHGAAKAREEGMS